MKIKKIWFLLAAVFTATFLCCFDTGSEAAANNEKEADEQVTAAESEQQFITSGNIWIAGDSIAADHSYEDENNYARFVHGWGEVIGNYLNENASVHNLAISGQSAKYFVEEDNYKEIMDNIGEGDFLLIQFGHNDYKSDGSDHYSLPTTTEGSYKWYLKNYYIEPALKAGAMPVLCTSVVCCEFVDGFVKEDQAQSLFAGAMKELYNEYKECGTDIGLIDTYELTQTMLSAYSSSASSFYALKYDRKTDSDGNKTTSLDHVHFSLKGAEMTADMIAENLFVMYPDFNRFNKQALVDAGEGTKENPYLISSFSQVYRIMQDEEKNSADKYYKLTKDLNPVIQNKETITVFYANLDGDNHTVINPAGRAATSFISKNYGMVSNLNLQYKMNHTSDSVRYPFVAENYGVIIDCNALGEIIYDCYLKNENEWKCGVFAGFNAENAVIKNCKNNTSLTINTDTPLTYIGAITGYNAGNVSDCVNSGMIKLDVNEYKAIKQHEITHSITAGIAGILGTNATISNCENDGQIIVFNTLLADKAIVLKDKIAVSESEIVEQGQFLKGDVDKDGTVTLADVLEILKYAVGINEADEETKEIADYDGDGSVSLDDVMSALKEALGILSV